MKILKFRYLLIAVLVVAICLILGLYFLGGLKARADMIYDNEEFRADDFESYAERGDSELDSSIEIYNNGTYTMFFDEKTTIVKIALNSSCKAPDSPNLAQCKVVYETADSTSDVATEKSNFLLRYYLENGTINSTDLSSWANSVQYENRITGLTERHYSVNYLEDGVDILYEIGNFTNVSSYFPSEFDRATYDSLFRGNLVFYNPTDTEFLKQEDLDIVFRYSGKGATYSKECAAYLEEQGYSVTEAFDTEGKSYGYWNLDGLADAEGRIKLKIGVDYNTYAIEGEEGYSPCTANPFTNYSIINYIYGNTVYELKSFEDGKSAPEDRLNIYPTQYVENSSQVFRFRASKASIIISNLLKYMYTINEYDAAGNQTKENYYQIYDSTKRINRDVYYDYKGDGELSKFKIGGFQSRDEDGRFLFDENGDPIQAGFTQELAMEQNELFGHTEESKSTRFKVALRFRLTDEGFSITALNDSIEELSDSRIYQLELLPYFTVNNDKTSTGQIIVPDGSGAIISFNSVKDVQNASTYYKQIYGDDMTIPKQERGAQSQTVMLAMYGFLDQTKKRGVVAIVDKGASMSWIQADFLREAQTTSYNYARFITDLRTYETVSLSYGSTFNKWTTDIYPGDIKYEYRFLGEDELSYVDVARVYREYLLDKYYDEGLREDGDKTTTHTPTVTFLGAFEKKTLTLGYVYDKKYSLTTFKQAQEILEELAENGVQNFDVGYEAWTQDCMSPEITGNPKAARVLGGASDLKDLSSYLKSKGYNFYPELKVGYGSGFDYPYGQLKYSPKSITADYSTIAQFVAATGLADTKRHGYSLLSPRFYESYVNKFIKSISKYNFGGLTTSAIGNMCIGDYSSKHLTYAETSLLYQQDVLADVKAKVGNIMVSKPFDYVFPYINVAKDVPMVATMYPSIDYSIPLYQLVVSGLFDYSGEAVNINDDYAPEWYFLKALETGSNLSFELSAEDTKILLDTYNTDLYGTYYINWKHKIIKLNKQLNEVGIYESRLVSHEYLTDNVVKVVYENGLTLIINFDDAVYQDKLTGQAISANWYIIVEEGA